MKSKITIFIMSFILQITLMYFLASYHQPELYEYEQIAVNLLTKYTFVCHRLGSLYYSLVPPLYPFLSAGVYLLSNYSHLAMLLVQIVLTSLLCVIVYSIGKDIFDKKIGIISGILCIFHPGLIIYSIMKIHELSLVSFMFSLLILTILKFGNNITYRKSLMIGFIIGLTLLTRASVVLFIPLFLIWLYSNDVFKAKRDYLYHSLFILFISIVVIFPWIVRNYLIHDKFVFMQTPSVDFWVGNNINATGSNYLKDGRTVLEAMPKDFISKIYTADELAKDKIFKEEVYKFIVEHPYKFIFLFFKKLYYFWWFSPQSGIKYPHSYFAIYKIFYSLVLFFAIWGAIFILKSREQRIKRKAYLLLLFFLTISIMQSLFYVEGRHRWAIEPLLLIFSASGLFFFTTSIKKCLKMKI